MVEPTLSLAAVPAGLGGTIELARDHLEAADRLIRGAGGSDTPLAVCLEQTIYALRRWLTPSAVTVVAAMARECRHHAHRLAWAFYTQPVPQPCPGCQQRAAAG